MPTELEIAFDKLIEEKNKETEREYKNYHRGFINLEELKCNLKTIYCSYFDFLKENGIKEKITDSNWKDVLSDYEKWKNDKLLDMNCEHTWLVSRKDSITANEISLFFRIMEFMKIPIEYYSPIPDSVPQPIISFMIYGERDKVYFHNNCDDGGLLQDPDPIGKTFIFTDKYGLKTNIKIQKHGRNFNNYDEFIGVGTVEGFTSSTPIEITVETYKKEKIVSLYTDLTHETYSKFWEEYKSFPLWQEYFKLSDAKTDIFNNSQELFFHEHFNKQ